jgi:hypothetical protein
MAFLAEKKTSSLMICHKNCFLILIIVFGGGLGWLGVE